MSGPSIHIALSYYANVYVGGAGKPLPFHSDLGGVADFSVDDFWVVRIRPVRDLAQELFANGVRNALAN